MSSPLERKDIVAPIPASIVILSGEIKRLRIEIRDLRDEYGKRPTIKAMLQGRIMHNRRKIRDFAGFIREYMTLNGILCTR